MILKFTEKDYLSKKCDACVGLVDSQTGLQSMVGADFVIVFVFVFVFVFYLYFALSIIFVYIYDLV